MHYLIAAAALALGFQLTPAPADAPKQPSFYLQGYASDGDHTIVSLPQFAPETADERPQAYVTFESPVTGKCGVAMWETINGKTSLEMRKVVDLHRGERGFFHIVLPTRQDLRDTDWASLPLDHYGIAAICAVTDGPGSGPETMVESNFYVALVPST